MPQFDSNAASLWHWSFGCNGVLLALSFYYFWKNRRSDLAEVFIHLLSVQLLFLAMWHLSEHFHFSEKLNPNGIWWNMGKNAMMVTWPLVSVLFGSIVFSEILESLKGKKRNITAACVFLFFTFLQDPLVKGVGFGPWAPHSPRFSAYKNIYEMYWQSVHAPPISSSSGNTVLVHRSLPEADMTEFIFDEQKAVSHPLQICFDSETITKFSNYALEAYSFDYFTGARTHSGNLGCDYFIIPKERECKNSQVQLGLVAKLCGSW